MTQRLGDMPEETEYETVRIPHTKEQAKEHSANIKAYIDELYNTQVQQVQLAREASNQKALRYNEGKIEWSLVDFKALEPMVRVLMFGAKKYSPNNWKKGLPIDKILDSMIRHLVEIQEGKALDEESRELIVGHVLCNAMFLSHFVQKEIQQPSEKATTEIVKGTHY
jgi:hypothetical protein